MTPHGPRRATPFARGIAFVLVALCGVHAARRILVDAADSPWPRRLDVANYEWIERRVRGLGELGVLRIGEPAPEEHTQVEAKVQHAIVPTVLVQGERPLSAVLFEVGMDHERVRAELAERGFAHVLLRPRSNVGLAGRDPPPPLSEHHAPATTVRLALLLALLLAPALAAALRGGTRPAFLALLAAPVALAAAAAAGDATRAPLVVTCGLYALLAMAWTGVVGPLRAAPVVARPRERVARWALAVLVLLAVVGAVLRFGLLPEGGVDAIRMFNLRARHILRAEAFLAPFTSAGYLATTHVDYPPLVPFAVAGAYRVAGGPSVLASMLVQAAFWIGGAGFIAQWAWRAAGPVVGLAALALLAINPFWVRCVTEQLCDAPLGLSFAGALVAWRLSQVDTLHARRYAVVCGTLLSAALLTKNEGALLVLAAFAALTAWTLAGWRARRATLASVAFALVPAVLAWVAFAYVTPENDLVQYSSADRASWSRAARIAEVFARRCLDPMLFKSTFALAALVTLLRARRGARSLFGDAPGRPGEGPASFGTVVGALVAFALAGYFAAYLFTPHDLEWHLRTSSNRLFAQLQPAVVVLLAAHARPLRSLPG